MSEHYLAGLNAYHAGSYDSAAVFFGRAIEQSKRAQYFDARAQCYEKLGRLNDALADVRASLKLDGTATRCYARGAKLWCMLDRDDVATKLLLRGISQVKDGDDKETLNKLVNKIRKRQAACAIETGQQSAAARSISDLPHEVLLTIFEALVEDEWDTLVMTDRRPVRPVALTLSQVCHRWHSVSHSSSSLWQKLAVYGRTSAGAYARAKMYLIWNRGACTDLYIADTFHIGLGSVTRLLDSALCDKRRIEAITINIDCTHDKNDAWYDDAAVYGFARFVRKKLQKQLVTLDIKLPKCAPLFEIPSVLCGLVEDYTKIESFNASRHGLCHVTHRPSTSRTETQDGELVAFFEPDPRDSDSESGARGRNRPYLESVDVECDHLKRLSLVGGMGWPIATGTEDGERPYLISLPNLTELRLHGFATHTTLANIATGGQLATFDYADSVTSSERTQLPNSLVEWSRLRFFRFIGRPQSRQVVRDMCEARVPLTSLEHFRAELFILPDLVPLFEQSNAPVLRSLDLSKSVAAERMPIVWPVEMASSFTTLALSACDWVDDSHVRALRTSAPNLVDIDLSNVPRITAGPILEYVKFREPAVSSIANGTADGKEKAKVYSLVERLNLEGCTQLEEIAVLWLKNNIKPGGFKFSFYDAASERKAFRVASKYMP